MGRNEVLSFCERFLAAYNGHDLDEMVALYAEDAEVQTPDMTEPLRGKAAIREYLRVQLEAFPDMRFDLTKLVADESSFADDGIVSGTNTGPFAQPGGEPLSPTGKALRLPVAELVELADGKVTRHRLYWDQILAFTQLGLMEMPQAAPTGG